MLKEPSGMVVKYKLKVDNMKAKTNEFYIGWQDKAPGPYASHIKKCLFFLGLVVACLGMALALTQKKFSTANFEFGKLTEVRGIYFKDPVPILKAINGKDIRGNISYISIPLVGFGKFGADGVMAELEEREGTSLDRREIVLKGTLLYNDGKLLMQVDCNDKPLIKAGPPASNSLLPSQTSLGMMTIKGEIVDPKCYFGVMKPGQGKPHKDCAIRCISGGIPPVLRTVSGNGAVTYYLIVGESGEKMNAAVKDFVAEPVSLQARVVKYDDWIILYTKPGDIQRISGRDLVQKGLLAISCNNVCSK